MIFESKHTSHQNEWTPISHYVQQGHCDMICVFKHSQGENFFVQQCTIVCCRPMYQVFRTPVYTFRSTCAKHISHSNIPGMWMHQNGMCTLGADARSKRPAQKRIVLFSSPSRDGSGRPFQSSTYDRYTTEVNSHTAVWLLRRFVLVVCLPPCTYHMIWERGLTCVERKAFTWRVSPFLSFVPSSLPREILVCVWVRVQRDRVVHVCGLGAF